jgi:ankyrin repeat protein
MWEQDYLYEEFTQSTISGLIEAGASWNADGVDTDRLIGILHMGPMKLLFKMVGFGMPLQPDDIPQRYYDDDKDLVRIIIDAADGVNPMNISSEVRLKLLKRAKKANPKRMTTIRYDKAMKDELFLEAVIHAVEYGQVSTLHALITDDRFTTDLKLPSGQGTLLHIATRHDNPACMKLLLDEGFDPTAVDDHSWTALHHAIESDVDDVDILRRLIHCNIADVMDHQGRTVWHVVAEKGRLDILDMLFSYHGSNHPSLFAHDKSGRSPLLIAIFKRHIQVASQVLRSVPLGKTSITDPRVLQFVVAAGLEDLLRELLGMGIDLQAVSDEKQNALYFTTTNTTREMLELLLSHGLNVDHLDCYGRSAFLDLLDIDRRAQRLATLGYSNTKGISVRLSAVRMLATPFCVRTQDQDGNFAWLYFCTKMISQTLLGSRPDLGTHTLMGLCDILIQQGALAAYQEATSQSGAALLIKACLDSALKSGDHYREVISLFIKTVSHRLLEATTATTFSTAHPQAVRLLIWSATQPESDVLEQLLRRGANVHATCEDYGGDSAIDVAVERIIGENSFDMILAHANPSRIPKLDENGSMRHFVLCRHNKPGDEEYLNLFQFRTKKLKIATPKSKLEALFKKGVDPNLTSIHRWTAVSIAAAEDELGCLQSLVAYSANLLIMNQNGWTVIHSAIACGRLPILKYLRLVIKENVEWERPAAFLVAFTESGHQPLGPLLHEKYLRCSPTHFAAYSHSSGMLQFLQQHKVLGNINAEAQDGVTPLHLAVCVKSPRTTRWLLKNGADVKAKCGLRGISALHIALRWGRLEHAIALIQAGAEFSADSAGITPEMQMDPTICADLLGLLPGIKVPIPPAVMENVRRRDRVSSSGGLLTAIVDGDVEACSSIIAAMTCFPVVVDGCGPCTPLILALAHDELSIAKLLLDRGSHTNGAPCLEINRFGFEASSLEIAIQNPVFNSLLEQLLDQCLLHGTHWSQRFGYWRPFHIAAAFNPGAIKILANHVLKHVALFRYVQSIRH